MRHFIFLALALFVAGCAQRTAIPPAVSVLHDKKPLPPRKYETIVIDAGHGGKDGGTSKSDTYLEKKYNLETALQICSCLKQLGYKTILTRSHDTFVELDRRVEIANSSNADLFVSIHYNYSSNSEAKGVEVYYNKEEKGAISTRVKYSKMLADRVLKNIVTQTGATSRGLKEAKFVVIRDTRMPAILIEGGFLSNPRERDKIVDSQYQRSMAWGIAKGIDAYLESSR